MRNALFATTALLFSSVALADLGGLDLDQNGYLSPEEAADSAAAASRWSELDANADGRISPAEFSALEISEGDAGAADAGPDGEAAE